MNAILFDLKKNKMKNYLKIFVPIMVVIMAGLITISFSQSRGSRNGQPQGEGRRGFGGPPPGFALIGGGLHPRALAQLNLTDEQKEQMKTLGENARAASESNFEKMKTFQDHLKAATENGTFNQEQIREILNARSQVLIEIEVVRLRTDAAILNLLTAEQKSQLEQIKQKGFEGGREGFRTAPQN
jgi:Spy/CpxP family protein refolding chaperone